MSDKKRKNSKAKGNSFELQVTKLFADKFGGDWRRVPNSGAFTGGKNRDSLQDFRADAKEILSADIITPAGFPYQLECKSYNDEPKFHQLLESGSKKLDEWIKQSDEDAKFSNKKPLIVFKMNRKGIFVCLNQEDFSFENTARIIYKSKVIVSLKNFFDCFPSQ